MKKNLLLIVTALFLAISILGCNTFRGAGKDMESGGKSIQRAVDKND
ncbi:MAG: entericidin A/B family lipoprotein [Candidatus Omnitrophota bacterium]|nr:entericidin A/B family lipoprotein [Candidatus Omnitrophota bacterium]